MIILPGTPGPRSSTVQPVTAGGVIDSALGGASQIVSRGAVRHQLSVQLPPMQSADARTWFAALAQAVRVGARMQYRQPGLVIGAVGAPVVNGGSQTGSTLALRGCAPGLAFVAGQLISFFVGARSYAYVIGAAASANGAGLVNLPLASMIRMPPADGAAVAVAAPVIEGSIGLDDPLLPLDENRLAGGLGFTITELG